MGVLREISNYDRLVQTSAQNRVQNLSFSASKKRTFVWKTKVRFLNEARLAAHEDASLMKQPSAMKRGFAT